MTAPQLLRQLGQSIILCAGLGLATSALADIEADCAKVGEAAAWTIFAGYGHDVTPERVIETTPMIDGVSTFDDLIWDEDRVHDLISQIIASKFDIDRSEAGMRKSFFFGEFFRLQCVAEAERNVRFQKLPGVKPAIEKCIDTSAQNRLSFELCILDRTVDKESWKDYTGPMKDDDEQ